MALAQNSLNGNLVCTQLACVDANAVFITAAILLVAATASIFGKLLS